MRNDIDYRLPANRKLGFTKFYQFMVETEDCSPDIAVETWLADHLKMTFEQRCVMAFFHGAAYEGSTEVIMAVKFPIMTAETIPEMIAFHDANFTDGQGLDPAKQIKRLTRSPDAMHRWREPDFAKFMMSVAESIKPYKTLGGYIKSCFIDETPEANYAMLQLACTRDWKFWGRMGHWCFSEALHRFIKAPINPPTMEFADGKGIRQGFAFCLDRDDLVEHATADDIKWMEGKATAFLHQFECLLGHTKNVNRFTLETCCCNYKRQHKGSRYGGCYVDEQYDALVQMKRDWPEYTWLADAYIQGRKAVLPNSLLYELNDHDTDHAHVKTWNRALVDYGRMPRVEAYFNETPQQWTDLEHMDFAKSGSDLTTLME